MKIYSNFEKLEARRRKKKLLPGQIEWYIIIWNPKLQYGILEQQHENWGKSFNTYAREIAVNKYDMQTWVWVADNVYYCRASEISAWCKKV